MNGMSAHLKLTGTALAASVSLLVPVAAQASSAGSTTQGGWGWWDAAIWGGALCGIVLLGFFGELVVGAVIFGVVAVFSGGAAAARRLAVRASTRTRTTPPMLATRAALRSRSGRVRRATAP